ncbi:MAG: DNA internalization-related competence protein ComEC/Rec2 [bacterium]|jgi:competence protein ComEC
MHRTIVLIAAAFAAGIAANNGIEIAPGYLIVALAFLLGWHLQRFRYQRTAPAVSFLLLAALAGALAHSFAVYPAVHSVMHWAGRGTVILSGIIADCSAAGSEQPFILVRSERVATDRGERKASGGVRAIPPAALPLCPGDRIRLTGEIELAAAAANPGEFNYRAYLLRHGVQAVMRADAAERLVGTGPASLAFAWKNSLMRINTLTLPPDYAALLSGMLYGAREGVPVGLADRLRKTGATHIITVSGLHIGFIAGLTVFLGRLLRLSGRAAGVVTAVGVAFYIFIVGAAPPVLRAGVMTGAGVAGSLLGREKDRYASFAAAVLVVLAINPLYLFDTGFQLSFVTTFSLIHLAAYFAARLSFLPRRLRGLLGVALAAQLGIAPLLLYYFFTVTPAALPANLIIVPLAGVSVVLGFAAGLTGQICLGAAGALNAVNLVVLRLIIGVADFCSRLPGAELRLTPPALSSLLLFYLLLFSIPYWRQAVLAIRGRISPAAGKAGIFVCLALLAVLAWASPPESMNEVTFLAVGQGSAAFIRTGLFTGVLVDGGNRYDGEGWSADLGERVVEPFLRRQGIRHLDIIYTHGHDDHIGGLVTVAERFRVGTLYGPPAPGDSPLYRRLREVCRIKNIPFRALTAGDNLRLRNGALITVLHPAGAERTGELNEDSLVFRLSLEEMSVLFTGDCGPAAIGRLLTAEARLASDVIVIPHHGSRTAYSPELYRAVKPKYAIIPVGRNIFGHPAPEVVTALQSMGVTVCRTDFVGAVTATPLGGGLRMTTFSP